MWFGERWVAVVHRVKRDGNEASCSGDTSNVTGDTNSCTNQFIPVRCANIRAVQFGRP